jgi:hypothetical protein
MLGPINTKQCINIDFMLPLLPDTAGFGENLGLRIAFIATRKVNV